MEKDGDTTEQDRVDDSRARHAVPDGLQAEDTAPGRTGAGIFAAIHAPEAGAVQRAAQVVELLRHGTEGTVRGKRASNQHRTIVPAAPRQLVAWGR
eukprot:scaffold25995_cov70-Phaeocystis_antarctica.AAC.7